MPGPSPRSGADCNLLFGILALQMDFIGRDALIAAMHAWVLDKGKPIAKILVEQGAMRGDARELLEPLVQKHLEIRGNDPEKAWRWSARSGRCARSWKGSSTRIFTPVWPTCPRRGRR